MVKSLDNLAHLKARLSKSGLVCFGVLEISIDVCPAGNQTYIGRKALLVGNAGTDMWNIFSKSYEFSDGELHPMNRWTKRTLDSVAQEIDVRVVYPFDEPYWPFQRLAQKAVGVKSSPLGILIHPQYGLWHAFRGLLILDDNHAFMNEINDMLACSDVQNHPCDTCEDKPCLSACPVGTFNGEHLDVQSCFSHLDAGNKPDCMSVGCQARTACPIASDYKYDNEQIGFHMKSYRGLL